MDINLTDQLIIHAIKQVPQGKVSTYGQIAKLAGENINPRRVGYVLKKYTEQESLNWQRIINSQGRISVSRTTPLYAVQKQLLIKEGVVISKNDKIDLLIFQYSFS